MGVYSFLFGPSKITLDGNGNRAQRSGQLSRG
jgi:hypothetical protein